MFYTKKACFWNTSKVRLIKMFAWSVFLLSSLGPGDIVVSLLSGVWKFLVRPRPHVRKYDLWRSFLLCGSQPRSVPRRLNDISMICTAQSDPLNFQSTLNNREWITDAGSDKGIKSSSHIKDYLKKR